MYSWVVHFLSYFISIFRERRRERESRGRGIVVIELFNFFIFFNVNSFLCTVFYHHHYSMQGFVFISFILISLFNARFRFHHHFILGGGGGFIVHINKLYDFPNASLFFFSYFRMNTNAGTCWSQLFLAHFTTLFRMVTKSSGKTDIVSMASSGQGTSYLNRLLQSFLHARTVTKSWCSVGMFFDRYTNFKFINWYLDMTIWI